MKYFKKSHLIFKKIKNKKIFNIIQGQFCVYFNSFGILNFNEYKALKFYFRKKLKIFSKKLFFRITPKLKNTKKSIGVRMGKGKGALNNFYFVIKKGQIFFEFMFKNKINNLSTIEKNILIKTFKKFIFLGSIKSNIKMKLKKND
jgi:ribosomal protein L16/L10AE